MRVVAKSLYKPLVVSNAHILVLLDGLCISSFFQQLIYCSHHQLSFATIFAGLKDGDKFVIQY